MVERQTDAGRGSGRVSATLTHGSAPARPADPGRGWRAIDWLWTVRGSLPLDADALPGDDAVFARLEPLLQHPNTSRTRAATLRPGDTLLLRKHDQAAQDPLAIFEGGTLRIDRSGPAPVLRWRLTSRALLACLLAPLLFIGFAQATIAIHAWQHPAGAADKASATPGKGKDHKVAPLNPVDAFLGAPAPEAPKDGEGKRGKKASPTAAYVFAGIFAALYVIGRVLEDWLLRRRLRQRLAGE